ncbi:hypothetical protein M2352_002510 [Azospirillum fermentarium]|uniref:hypothetical protein n=1 Tax=Azospirillum fermentarium TaxID=1233114 RepID=UPI002227FBE9|nr:hypothetical protein [Azospirillum fermentarium]MCW2246919.1 hypothetical protein [Azospirillum fermentarium]
MAETETDSLARLTPEEVAFLLGGGLEEGLSPQEKRAARFARANAVRTARRAADPDFAERLRAGERERQARHRAAQRAGHPAAPPPPAAAAVLPPIPVREAARRLAEHLRADPSRQAQQLRGRADLVQRYLDGFVVYQHLSAGGRRPTRGALAEGMRHLAGVELTPSQVQKLRDHIEGFARPGGPWHPDRG